ncbi:MAG: hypothetical protein DYG89_33070 [Caldilinea sp. CFX5]|nr:hypothetical protein [Caldilinea sp. CFX5]
MRNQRIAVLILVVGLLAILTTTAYATSSYHPAAPSIVGTWKTVIPQSEGNPRPTFESFLTFFADGNMIEANSSNPALAAPAHGVWIGSGNTYLLTFEAFSFDEQGKHTGKIQAHLAIKMDGPDHFTATYTADVIDLAGKVTKKVVYGTSESTRMEVVLPE